MPSVNFPHDDFGLPILDGHQRDVDFNIARTTSTSGFVRQRRMMLHTPSLFKIMFRVRGVAAYNLIQWLQENDDWFSCKLLVAGACEVSSVDVRRTSTISCGRIQGTDTFTVSFEAESRSMTGYAGLAAAHVGQPIATYPASLPLPLGSNFTSEHDNRNITTYSMTYRLTTRQLKQWLEFAAFVGASWFKHRMVSPNVLCGDEIIRYTSNPAASTIGPDRWEVSVSAETMPQIRGADYIVGTSCLYDDPSVSYEQAGHPYECT
jgi:hypothetical protein